MPKRFRASFWLVRSQKGEDLTLGYFKGDIADSGEISKGLYQMLNFNHASLESLHNNTERYRFDCQGEIDCFAKTRGGVALRYGSVAGRENRSSGRDDKFV